MIEHFLPQPSEITPFMHPTYWDGHHTRDNHSHLDLPRELYPPELTVAQATVENVLHSRGERTESLTDGVIDPRKMEDGSIVFIRQERLRILSFSGIQSPEDSRHTDPQPRGPKPRSLQAEPVHIPGINARYDSVTRIGVITQSYIMHEPTFFVPNKTRLSTPEAKESSDTPFGVSLAFSRPVRIGCTYHFMPDSESENREEVYLRFNYAEVRTPSL